MLADTGGVLWTRQQVDALLRHRFGLAYGGRDTDVSAWKLRTDYRFGERYALGFAITPTLAQVLIEAASALDLTFSSWMPAFAWGLERFRPQRRWAKRPGWWIWSEQDRALVAHLTRGRLDVLNPAAHEVPSDIERLVALEAMRSGIGSPTEAIALGQWRSTGALVDSRVEVYAGTTEEASQIQRGTSLANSRAPQAAPG
jgi:hypothetical protein